ncbi:MAG TPA: AbrB/MazE/SpoVT family DNA-binding domain-containing protein [Armatimonadota bacterium]|jgi:AbrB family looped-hinge helix DNA binding protein
MKTTGISERGQVTIPAAIRRKLNIQANTRFVVTERDSEVVFKPLRTIADVAGIFHDYAIGKTTDWETIREETMKAVAEEVAREGL